MGCLSFCWVLMKLLLYGMFRVATRFLLASVFLTVQPRRVPFLAKQRPPGLLNTDSSIAVRDVLLVVVLRLFPWCLNAYVLRAIAIVCEVTDFRLGVCATETVQFKLRSLRGFVGRR